jgi:hypothetical protein
MQDNLKDKGFNISCVDDGDSSGNGSDDCASAEDGGNSLMISNLGTDRCKELNRTIRHEMQHGAGDVSHAQNDDGSLDCENDSVYGCDVACYEISPCPGAKAENCQ